ncbi:MAG: signal peptide peptidase SppA [Deltaproteobacteria bacterium]|nr:signal peptide peptidase SppA [Deltaproteobacteria bacterium]
MLQYIPRLISCISLVFLIGCTCISIPSFVHPVQPLEERVVEGKGPSKILLLDISGTISEERKSRGMGLQEEISLVDRIKEELKKAESDKSIEGIIVRINSPGGTVTASDIIYHELREFKKRTGVKIIATLMDTAASGGYYVAVAADRIIAHPTTITGSIGVIALKFNVQELLTKIGIEEESIKSGDKKDLMSPFRPTTPDEREMIQTIIDKLHQRFVDVIVEGRPSLTHKEMARLADGRIFTADQALEAKLIDSIGYMDNAINIMKDDLGIRDASVMVYYRPGSYKGTIYSTTTAAQPSFNLLSINSKGLSILPDVRFMYLWMP